MWQGDTLHQSDRPGVYARAIEQPLLFPGNDLPGVMLSGGALRLATLYGVKPGERAVVAAVCDRGLEAAAALHDAGVELVAGADLRNNGGTPGLNALMRRGVRPLRGMTVLEARGRDQVQGVVLGKPGALRARASTLRMRRSWSRAAARRTRCSLKLRANRLRPPFGHSCYRGARRGLRPARSRAPPAGTPSSPAPRRGRGCARARFGTARSRRRGHGRRSPPPDGGADGVEQPGCSASPACAGRDRQGHPPLGRKATSLEMSRATRPRRWDPPGSCALPAVP